MKSKKVWKALLAVEKLDSTLECPEVADAFDALCNLWLRLKVKERS